MREGVESVLAVIASHTALADSAESHLARSEVNNNVVYATAAVRNSSNGNVFVEEVKKATGLSVDVVSGELEAELALNGATLGLDGGVIDVGGASSEVSFRKNGKKVYGYSLSWGAVKIFDAYGRDKDKILSALENLTVNYGEIPNGEYKAVGGTATSIASVDLKLKTYLKLI